jgi:hypothetical protein
MLGLFLMGVPALPPAPGQALNYSHASTKAISPRGPVLVLISGLSLLVAARYSAKIKFEQKIGGVLK